MSTINMFWKLECDCLIVTKIRPASNLAISRVTETKLPQGKTAECKLLLNLVCVQTIYIFITQEIETLRKWGCSIHDIYSLASREGFLMTFYQASRDFVQEKCFLGPNHHFCCGHTFLLPSRNSSQHSISNHSISTNLYRIQIVEG